MKVDYDRLSTQYGQLSKEVGILKSRFEGSQMESSLFQKLSQDQRNELIFLKRKLALAHAKLTGDPYNV